MASKDKGKAVAGDYSSGKRKRDGDGDKSDGRRRKNMGVLQFFEVDADVAEDDESDDDSFIDNDFMQEEPETEVKGNTIPAKSHHLPFFPKEEELSGDELERVLEERYRDGSGLVTYAEDEYESKRSIEKNSLDPSMKERPIWKVKCMVGREKHSAFCLMQKYVDLQTLGTKLNIISAFAVEHIKGYVYIEADKQSDVHEAAKGLCSIYASRMTSVPTNEAKHLLSIRNKCNGVIEGTWARVKSGNYKGDLAEVVAVNNERKRATIRLIPRINLQALVEKLGGGAPCKKPTAQPAARLISSSELLEFGDLVQYRRDRDTGLMFKVLDGMMLKDGYLYKKISTDSLCCWGVVPSDEELQKFKPSDRDESVDMEWLNQLYGEERKKRCRRISLKSDKGGGKGVCETSVGKGGGKASGGKGGGEASGGKGGGEASGGKGGEGDGWKGGGKGGGKGDGKGEGSSESSSVSAFDVHDFVCFGRKDFGIIISMEKDRSCKILKEGPKGQVVVTAELHNLKNAPFDRKFTALDQHMKVISINDTVKVLEGPSKGRQGTVKQIYRGIIFLCDESEMENSGYFCFKSQMCEKVKLSDDAAVEQMDDVSGLPGFGDFSSSPKSPLSPKKMWQTREKNNDFKERDKDGTFSIGQTLRIRVGPLKGYLCRVLALRRSDVTVKLDSQHKVLTVKSEHLAEAQKSSVPTSMDAEDSSQKPPELLGAQDGSADWMGVGTVAGSSSWNAGGQTSERSSWSSFPTSSILVHPDSNSENPFGTVNNMNTESDAWEKKVVLNQDTSAASDEVGGWGKATVGSVSGNQESSWGKSADPWNKDKSVSENLGNCWSSAAAGTKQVDSWGKGGAEGSSDKEKVDVGVGGSTWGKAVGSRAEGTTDELQENAWSKAAENVSQGVKNAEWKSATTPPEKAPKSWGSAGGGWAAPKAEDKGLLGSWNKVDKENGSRPGVGSGTVECAAGWMKSEISNKDQSNSWNKPSEIANCGSWDKRDGPSTSQKLGGSSWNKGDTGSWGKQDGASSWQKQGGNTTCNKTGGRAEEKPNDQGNQNKSWDISDSTKKDGLPSWDQDGGSLKQAGGWGKQSGGTSWGKQTGETSGGTQTGGNSWGKQTGGTSWGKQEGEDENPNQERSWDNSKSFEGGRGFGGRRGRGRGGRDTFGRGRSFSGDRSGGWNKGGEDRSVGWSKGGDDQSVGWNKGGDDQSGGWNKGGDNNQSGGWNKGGDNNQSGGWNKGGDNNQSGGLNQKGDSQTGAWNKAGGNNQSGGWSKGGGGNESGGWKGGGGNESGGWNKGGGGNESGGWNKGGGGNESGGWKKGGGGNESGGWNKGGGGNESGGWNKGRGGNESGGWNKGGGDDQSGGWKKEDVDQGGQDQSGGWKKNEESSLWRSAGESSWGKQDGEKNDAQGGRGFGGRRGRGGRGGRDNSGRGGGRDYNGRGGGGRDYNGRGGGRDYNARGGRDYNGRGGRGRDNFGRGRSFSDDRSGGWNNGRDGQSGGWNKGSECMKDSWCSGGATSGKPSSWKSDQPSGWGKGSGSDGCQGSGWNGAAAGTDQVGGWGKGTEGSSKTTVGSASGNQESSWGKSESPWNEGKSVSKNPGSSWNSAAAGSKQVDSWGKATCAGGSSGIGEVDVGTNGSIWGKAGSSEASNAGWKCATAPTGDVSEGAGGAGGGCAVPKADDGGILGAWNPEKSVHGSQNKPDAASSWQAGVGSSSWNKTGAHAGGGSSSWSKAGVQAENMPNEQAGKQDWQKPQNSEGGRSAWDNKGGSWDQSAGSSWGK